MIGRYVELLADVESARLGGRVRRVTGAIAECEGLVVPIGSLCEIRPSGREPLRVEVVGFRDGAALAMALDETLGVREGDPVVSVAGALKVPVGDGLLGRVIDAEGRALDTAGPLPTALRSGLWRAAPTPTERTRSAASLPTGVRAIDGLLTCARGQRIGIFSGSGVGKTTLIGMIARATAADAVVLALVGERGREVRDFVERDLGTEGLKRCVIVAETADRPPVRRVKAAFAATAIAEEMRDRGKHVLLLVDSLSRVAFAQREVGLAAGEPPTTRGFPPSVYSLLPRLLERAGSTRQGSITGFYSVLAEGDDQNDPVADAARSVLDGHLWLSRDLANRGRFPAIDVLASVSRMARDVIDRPHADAAAKVRASLAVLRDAQDLIAVGAYVKGSDPAVDRAVRARPAIDAWLAQRVDEFMPWIESRQTLIDLARSIDE